MNKQISNDQIFQQIWQLHVEKAWCLRRLRETNIGLEECENIENHIADQIEILFGFINRRFYMAKSKNYMLYLNLFLLNPNVKEALFETAYDLANTIYEINPIFFSKGQVYDSLKTEINYFIDPTISNFFIIRDAIIKRGADLAKIASHHK